MIDLKCSDDACGHLVDYYRPLAKWDDPLPPCEACGAATYQSMDRSYRKHYAPPDPVIVYKAPDGSFRFPGDPNGLSAKSYDKSGFTRIELRGHADVRRFESQMNKQEIARAERRVAVMRENRLLREKHQRSDLRNQMQHFSRLGRDVARLAMERNDARPGPKAADTGFRVEVYSENRGNREVSRDERGRRRRD